MGIFLLSALFLANLAPCDSRIAPACFAQCQTAAVADSPGSKIVAYCKANQGKQIGNGECWTLANEAFKSVGITRPGGDLRVWGRVVNTKKERPMPGDIVEYVSAKFSNGATTGPNHTAVITKVSGRERFTVAEQNWGNVKTVRERPENLNLLKSGTVVIYRPGE